MPGILQAECPAGVPSAVQLGSVDGGLLPEGYGDVQADPETNRCNVTQATWPRIEKCASSQSTCRRGEEDSHRTARDRSRVPKKARTRVVMMSFSGPTARQDAERAEKSRWLAHLATLLVGTQTPLGQRLVEQPTTCNSMGLGLRSGNAAQAFSCTTSFLHVALPLGPTPPLATWSAGRYPMRLAPAGRLPWWRLLTCEALSTWALLSRLPFYFSVFMCT